MKKLFYYVFFTFMLAITTIIFTSCGSDDDDAGASSSSWLTNGTWTESSGIRKWTFKKDGTCIFEVDDQTWTPSTGYVSHWSSQTGQWSYDDNTKVLSTNVLSWTWVVVSQSDNMWTGQTSKGTLYTYSRK